MAKLPHPNLNTDRAQLQALGEHFKKEAERKKSGEKTPQKKPEPMSPEMLKGLAGLAARTNMM